MNDLSDNELIVRCRSDDQVAWGILLKRYERALWKLSIKHSKHTGLDVDDCMSHAYEAFTKAVRQFDFNGGAKFLTYLYMKVGYGVRMTDDNSGIYVPKNAFLNESTSEAAYAARRVLSLDAPKGTDNDESRAALIIATSDNVSQRLIEEENVKLAGELLSLLEERQRLVVRMRMNGSTLQDVGDALGITRERVRQIEDKAMETLKALATGEDLHRRAERRHGIRWSGVEVSFIRQRVSAGHTIKSCAESLGRSIGGTYRFVATRQKIVRPNVWTDQHDQFLREHRGKGWQWCADSLGRTPTSIHNRVRRLGIAQPTPGSIDMELIKELHAQGLSSLEIGRRVGRSDECIRGIRNSLGLSQNARDEKQRMKTLKRNLLAKYGTIAPSSVAQKIRARKLGYPSLPLGAALALTALKQCGPLDRDGLATAMKSIADENGWVNYSRSSWKLALKFAKWLVDHGLADCKGRGSERRIYSAVDTAIPVSENPD